MGIQSTETLACSLPKPNKKQALQMMLLLKRWLQVCTIQEGPETQFHPEEDEAWKTNDSCWCFNETRVRAQSCEQHIHACNSEIWKQINNCKEQICCAQTHPWSVIVLYSHMSRWLMFCSKTSMHFKFRVIDVDLLEELFSKWNKYLLGLQIEQGQ